MPQKVLPPNFFVERGQTQIDVNQEILKSIYPRFQNERFSLLDVPCGNMEFLTAVKKIFPQAGLTGGDMAPPANNHDIDFLNMNLTVDFPFEKDKKFDIVTTISGVMMFGNTLRFVQNCTAHLNEGGTFIVTNDNNATIKDKLSFFFLGRYRIFNMVFEDAQPMTENIPIHQLCRLLRLHNIAIEEIKYTSLYPKDLLFLPFAIFAYCFQYLYLLNLKTQLPKKLVKEMYPFKHLFCRHYIIYGKKTALLPRE